MASREDSSSTAALYEGSESILEASHKRRSQHKKRVRKKGGSVQTLKPVSKLFDEAVDLLETYSGSIAGKRGERSISAADLSAELQKMDEDSQHCTTRWATPLQTIIGPGISFRRQGRTKEYPPDEVLQRLNSLLKHSGELFLAVTAVTR